VITDTEIIETAKKIFDTLGKKIGTYKEMPSTLILFHNNGKKSRVSVDKLSNEFGVNPGQIVSALIPDLRKRKTLAGIMFFSEGWALKGTIGTSKDAMPPEAQADLAKINRGEMHVEDSEFRQECLMANIETRAKNNLYLMREIIRDENGKRSMGEAHTSMGDVKVQDRLVGFFQDPPPMPDDLLGAVS